MPVEVEIKIDKEQEMTVPINIKAEEPRTLIGESGHTLLDIQRLLGAILKRKLGKQFYINLDINGYKEKKAVYLKEMAQSIADDVSLSKQEKQLPPMPAPERRLIHMELADRSDVVTESIGQEPERYVAIKPSP
jgi:spoIIIJ-associated protein